MEHSSMREPMIRYDWIDTLKFLGIFAIYLGHFGAAAGRLYPFVFVYHVPLFFFVAGLFAKKDKDKSIKGFLSKKIKHLLVPYILYSLISIVSFSILNNYGLEEVLSLLMKSIFGIRNTLIAGSLWFIPCMFVVSCSYFLLNKISSNKGVIIISVGTLFIITQTVLPNNPMVKPSWIFNIDSAMYYLIYYMIGDFCVNKLLNFSYKTLTLANRWIVSIGALVVTIMTLIIYFKGVPAIVGKLPFSNPITDVVLALIIITFNILIAVYLKDIKLLRDIGKNTLSLCGVEDAVKVYLNMILITLGITLNLYNPLSCIVYTFVCLLVAHIITEKIINRYLLKK